MYNVIFTRAGCYHSQLLKGIILNRFLLRKWVTKVRFLTRNVCGWNGCNGVSKNMRILYRIIVKWLGLAKDLFRPQSSHILHIKLVGMWNEM